MSIICSKTRGIPKSIYKPSNVDSLHLRYQNTTISIRDTITLNKLTSSLIFSRRTKADRTNLNRSLIEINFYLKSGNEVQLLIIDNVIHGDLLVFGWIYYKNDDFISSIKKYIK